MSWWGRSSKVGARVIVVGAGLSGLAIARRLRVYGVDVTVVEAEPAIGGQCRSELVDGYLCDRGFHTVSPSGLSEVMDPSVLRAELRNLDPILIVDKAGSRPAVDPVGEGFDDSVNARGEFETHLFGVSPDASWSSVLQRPDAPKERSLYAAASYDVMGRASFNMTTEVLQGWEGEDASVFSGGIGRLPALLGCDVDVRLGVLVQSAARRNCRWVLETTAGPMEADQVVAATPASFSHGLLAAQGATTRWSSWWFAAPTAPTSSAAVWVTLDRGGAVAHVCVLSNVAPDRSPGSTALISATCLGDLPAAVVAKELAEIYGVDTSAWRAVAHYPLEIPDPVGLSGPLRMSTWELEAGFWQVPTVHGHVESIRRGEALGDRLAKVIGALNWGGTRRLIKERLSWEEW